MDAVGSTKSVGPWRTETILYERWFSAVGFADSIHLCCWTQKLDNSFRLESLCRLKLITIFYINRRYLNSNKKKITLSDNRTLYKPKQNIYNEYKRFKSKITIFANIGLWCWNTFNLQIEQVTISKNHREQNPIIRLSQYDWCQWEDSRKLNQIASHEALDQKTMKIVKTKYINIGHHW